MAIITNNGLTLLNLRLDASDFFGIFWNLSIFLAHLVRKMILPSISNSNIYKEKRWHV